VRVALSAAEGRDQADRVEVTRASMWQSQIMNEFCLHHRNHRTGAIAALRFAEPLNQG
jgi:hypothetical protein